MKLSIAFAGTLLVMLASFNPKAQALDLEGVFLVGTGVDTGKAENNPYALQFGGAAELTIAGFVGGVRITRTLATDDTCETMDCGPVVKDLRAFGGDFGWDWEISLLHLSPRLGVGVLDEKDGDRVSAYMEPGGVAEVEIGWFVAGADLRYRFAIKHPAANGFLAYGRIGLRF